MDHVEVVDMELVKSDGMDGLLVILAKSLDMRTWFK